MKHPVILNIRFGFTIVALLLATPLFAQFDFPVMSGAGAAMGGTSTALSDNSSALCNIAGLAELEESSISLSVRQNFMEEGMGYAAAGLALPTTAGSWGASFIHYGISEYHEQRISLMYALKTGEDLAIGAALYYLHSSTNDPYYEPLNRLTFSLAVRYRPTESLTLGFKAYNPTAVVSEQAEGVRTPALFTLGVACRLIEELTAIAEVEKNLYYKSSLRFGLEYSFLEDYALRTGVNTQPVIYSFGLGMKKRHFGFDIAMQIHQTLGMTPQMSLTYIF